MNEDASSKLLKAVQSIAISARDATAVVERLRAQSDRDHPEWTRSARIRIASLVISSRATRAWPQRAAE